MAYKKKNSGNNFMVVLAIILLLLFSFKDKLMGFWNSFFSSSKTKDTKKKVEIINTREKNINDLGMDIPDLSDLEKPIEFLRKKQEFHNIDTIVKDSSEIHDTSKIFAYQEQSRTSQTPISIVKKDLNKFETSGILPLNNMFNPYVSSFSLYKSSFN